VGARKRTDPGKRRPARTAGIERLLSGKPARRYRLRLYLAGSNLNSFRAIQTVRRLCDEILPGRVELETVDLYQQPELAKRDHIIAAPTLIKIQPRPRRMFIGDMTETGKILAGLGIMAPKQVHGTTES
jgi:circadian clock protein KaiB